MTKPHIVDLNFTSSEGLEITPEARLSVHTPMSSLVSHAATILSTPELLGHDVEAAHVRLRGSGRSNCEIYIYIYIQW